MKGNPRLSHQALVRVSRAVYASKEAEDLSASLSAFTQQGKMIREFEGKEAVMWATAVWKLPPESLKFALNASLCTYANLHKWGKHLSASCTLYLGNCQSLFHILNNCPKTIVSPSLCNPTRQCSPECFHIYRLPSPPNCKLLYDSRSTRQHLQFSTPHHSHQPPS